MDSLPSRRQFLTLASTGTALSVAGCGALQSGDSNETGGTDPTGTEDETDDRADGAATVAVGVQPDQERLSERQSEIRSQLEAGEINRTEAQQAIQESQRELTAEATSAFRERVSEGDLTIEESLPDLGAFLVTGGSAELIGLLSFEAVSGLFPEATFAEARARSEAGQ